MSKALNILIVDDEQELRRSIAVTLAGAIPDTDIKVQEAENGKQAVELVSKQDFDFVLMDVRMPEMDGMQALELIKEKDSKVFVVIMTAHSNLQDAINSIKLGAYDYLEKPVQPENIAELVKKALDTRELVSELAYSNPIFDDDTESELVGKSEKMQEVYSLINKLSFVDTTVLIRGENGTGKDLIARAIHFNSPRKHGEFVTINCAAIPEELMESEIFGHEKGAFTGAHARKIGKFQLAHNGTLFLDEIGELKPELQVKLLRVLQEKMFTPVGSNREIKTNARVIAATNRNLEKMIEDNHFREDLFYRLNVMPIYLPPLRDRVDDIDSLVEFFVKKFNKEHNKKITSITPEALTKFKMYEWPGNIRQLSNVLERIIIVSPDSVEILDDSLLPEELQNVKPAEDHSISSNYDGPMDFDKFKEQTEKEFIVKALTSNNGRINKTVAQANIPKNTLLRKIKKYGIDVKSIIKSK